MFKTKIILAATVTALLLTGCDDDSSSTGGSSDGAVSADHVIVYNNYPSDSCSEVDKLLNNDSYVDFGAFSTENHVSCSTYNKSNASCYESNQYGNTSNSCVIYWSDEDYNNDSYNYNNNDSTSSFANTGSTSSTSGNNNTGGNFGGGPAITNPTNPTTNYDFVFLYNGYSQEYCDLASGQFEGYSLYQIEWVPNYQSCSSYSNQYCTELEFNFGAGSCVIRYNN